MRRMIRVLAVLFAIVLAIPLARAQTLSGAQAQKSPPADAFLAYEKALLAGGLEGARPYMTPAKFDELEGMRKSFGEDGFRQFLDRLRGGAQGAARRKQIEKVEVKGEQAMLEARDGPNVLTVQFLARTSEGWKVDIRR
ncbi:hypothetical protein [Accumulibacter sp.]|uniref:hypothetical protein n=1 Tax=Accumulibacter sp. TaxID=2053492 RepID=UPI0025D60BFA|nr:hypothetical protein [Accumulibacter sp.]MCM8613000.1 hypothetical protein [Accumulibacter sp.]MCM8637050.1 hypothetical protein [Accumulibacter sp.]MCM8640700.1 hypothetical protein [Accumulibacter sp.]